MKMKRLLSGLLVVAMMLSLCVTTAFAAAADYKAGLTVSKKDDTMLSVSVDAGPADKAAYIQAVQSFVIAFDMEVLKPVNKAGTKELTGLTTSPSTEKNLAYEVYTDDDDNEWTTKVYVYLSADNKTCYYLIQPANGAGSTLDSMVSLAKLYLGFREGKGYKDVTATTVRFATWAETSEQAEKDAIKFNDGTTGGTYRWVPGGPADHNNLKFPEGYPYVKADGFTFAGGEVTKTLKSIAITTQPSKTEYEVGDTFDPAGMVVTANYSDDSTKKLDAKDYTYAPDGALAATDTKITVTYKDGEVTKTADVPITVKEKTPEPKTLESIAITTQPSKTEYEVGDAFNAAGMVVTATYSDTTTADVTAKCTNNAPAQFDTVGNQTITVTYTEGSVTKTADVTVTVKEKTPEPKTLESIAITTQPSKTEYELGDAFNAAGMVVTATYSDKTTADVTASCTNNAPAQFGTVGSQTITVTYTEGKVTKTADVTVTVKEKTPEPKMLESIAITTQPNKTEYELGDAFDAAGMVVTANYSDKSSADVTASCTNNAPAQFDTVGNQTITVTYTEGKVTKTADVTVTVKEKTPPVEKVAAPVISPNGTTFIGTQTVTITSATPGAQIYYTTDGSMPSAKSNPYTMPLTIASSCAIKAIAIKDGMEDSAVTTAYFTLYVPPIVVPGTTPSVASYPITVLNAKNGTVAASHKTAPKGATITLTVAPDKGFAMDGLAVVDGAGAAIKLTDMGNGKYTFIMPASKVTVEGSFKAAGAAVNPFVDVLPSDYCYDAVLWAVNQGVTSGVSSTMFAPNQPCTRAQIVTFLWRAAGSPAPKSASNFTDVPADAYYAKAVAWAVENGITGGTGDGKFSPDATCTRAQAVTFLYRASGSPAVSGSAAFTDVAADAYYAAAVAWAEKNGITGGIGGGLFGSNQSCTRGQIVTFLYRTYNK